MAFIKLLKIVEFDYLKKLSMNDNMNMFVFNWNIVKVNEIK